MRPAGSAAFPRMPLAAAGILVAVAIGAAALGRAVAAPPAPEPAAAVERFLRFEDRPDGGIDVRDGATGGLVAEIAPATDGFVRSTLRGFARDRKRRDLGPEAPFRLAASVEGRLTLEDALTGRTVALDAFGATNRDAFGRFLAARPSS